MPAVHIATAGVAVGLAVMILSVCLVKGFQGEVAAKLAGFASHIEVLDLNSQTDADNHPITADARAALYDAVKEAYEQALEEDMANLEREGSAMSQQM